MDLMHLTPKKTLELIQKSRSHFIAKVKRNQKALLSWVQEIEASSSISSDTRHTIKQSNERITRHVRVYSEHAYPFEGIFIRSIIRIDKQINGDTPTTHYYISNAILDAETFLKRILQEWSVETMHFYKDCALHEDRCKISKGAFSLSLLRSIVLNILHLNKIDIIRRKISELTYDLNAALALVSMTRLKYGFIR